MVQKTKTKTETAFEEAFEKISLSTWNRTRSDAELRDFVSRHHDLVLDVDLGL